MKWIPYSVGISVLRLLPWRVVEGSWVKQREHEGRVLVRGVMPSVCFAVHRSGDESLRRE